MSPAASPSDIDPVRRSASPSPARSKSNRFRFKSDTSTRHHRQRDHHDAPGTGSSREHSRQHHHRHRRRHGRPGDRHPTSPTSYTNQVKDDPAAYDDTYLPNSRSASYLDPDTVFRESLFDAMADDEGAAFWEGVYGQPIHVYDAPDKVSATGELESMTEDEYAAYVRARMYERTHQHIIEERRRREEAQAEAKRRAETLKANDQASSNSKQHHSTRSGIDDTFSRDIEESLKRGEARRARARWTARWEEYLKGWDKIRPSPSSSAAAPAPTQSTPTPHSKNNNNNNNNDNAYKDVTNAARLIPWPVESGKMKDALRKEAVEHFFEHAPSGVDGKEEEDRIALLKYERVRWHPDKMLQRFGGGDLVDASTMKAVTAVFQVVDRLWTDAKR
ncbi:MAG: hypothetical protein M1825_005092 [Sarcosagium campestre]|nr:MAG: hypothetical protein M1825_005092 [Sarcosagium campestre]